MNNNNRRLRMQDIYQIVQNNRTGTIAVCDNGMPYAERINYETDCFCGCLKLYFETCKCGELIEAIRNNNEAAILVNSNNNGRVNVLLEGTINILPPEVDCCCRVEDPCCIELEFIPNNIVGKRDCSNCGN